MRSMASGSSASRSVRQRIISSSWAKKSQQRCMLSSSSSRSSSSSTNRAYALSEYASATSINKNNSSSSSSSVPKSVLAVGSSLRYGIQQQEEDGCCSVIRPLGSSRRVYWTKDRFTEVKDMMGLSHRLRILSKNRSLNSILVGSTVPWTKEEADSGSFQESDIFVFPEMIRQMERTTNCISHDLLPLAKKKAELAHAGYSTDSFYHHHDHVDVEEGLEAIQHLTHTLVGKNSKIPIVSVVDGTLLNAGCVFALCPSYVLLSQDAAFQMTYPQHGLAMDPMGFSYVLNRRSEYEYAPTIAILLALCSYKANAQDMMETGLATHYLESMGKLAPLERALSELPPYNQQTILDTPIQSYTGAFHEYTHHHHHHRRTAAAAAAGQPVEDINAEFRNVAIANLLHASCTYDAAGQELGHSWTDEREFYANTSSMHHYDPSLNFGSEQQQHFLHQDRSSLLLDLAATLHPIIQQQSSVQGIMEAFQQIIADCQNNTNHNDDDSTKQCQALVEGLLQSMQQSSPLALRAIYRLLTVGSDSAETWESCMARETSVQRNLLQHSDYQTQSSSSSSPPPKWKHASVADVTDDEVEELL